MDFLREPLLGTIENHVEAGAVCAGVSLAPISPSVAARFAAIGSGSVVDAATAEAALLAVATGPVAILTAHLERLQALAASGRSYVEEAGTLFPIATGDEADTIAGMIGAIAGPRAPLPPGLLDDADFLQNHQGAIVGMDVARIVKALDALDATRAGIHAVEGEIAEQVLELRALAERARAPEAIAEARRRRVSTKASRVLPKLAVDLRQLHEQAAGIVARLASALEAVEGGL